MMNCMSSLNPFFQPDKVLLKCIPTLPVSTAPTTLSIIPSKLGEDALLSIAQVVNDNIEQYQPQY